MSGMHWEKRNKERKVGIPIAERHMRLPGWRNKPVGALYKRYPTGSAVHDNASPAIRAKRKARITLPSLSILKSD